MLKKIGISILLGMSLFGNTFNDFNKEVIKLNTAEKNKEVIKEELMKMVDFNLMGKLTLGKSIWLNINENQKKEYITLYENKIKRNYLKYLTEIKKVEIKDVKRKKNKYLINIVADDHNLKVFAYDNNKIFKIYNIEVDGINLIKLLGQDYRNQFKINGFKGILDILKKAKEDTIKQG